MHKLQWCLLNAFAWCLSSFPMPVRCNALFQSPECLSSHELTLSGPAALKPSKSNIPPGLLCRSAATQIVQRAPGNGIHPISLVSRVPSLNEHLALLDIQKSKACRLTMMKTVLKPMMMHDDARAVAFERTKAAEDRHCDRYCGIDFHLGNVSAHLHQ